ncbi:MAG: hypothetical protein HUJ30_02210 [Gammaproteobacteria bacterium]|nr:hypothetical protein [Gammaproteobacteria bacterium]
MQKNVSTAIVGHVVGQPIYKVVERNGINYEFSRMAECDDDGWCPLQQLKSDEIMLKNGLIYHRLQEQAAA